MRNSMKKNSNTLAKVKFFLLTLLLTASLLYADFANGDGTEANPYQISTIEQLNQVRDFADQNFILLNDLDFLGSPYDSTNSLNHKGWEPIKDFQGIFDGAGYVISNLYIMRPQEDSIGLFANTISGVGSIIKNLGLTNTKVNGKDRVGGIVGYGGGEIDLCYVLGTVNGSAKVGGIAGQSLSITNSYSNGNVNGYQYVGGISGYSYANISGCYSNSSVDGYEFVGGILGINNHNDIIEDCDEIGLLSGNVWYSYATGTVSGHDYIGGLIGANGANVYYSYANNIIEIKTDDSITDDKRHISAFANDYTCSNYDDVYYNKLLNQNITTYSVPGYDSLEFRDSSLIKLDYVDPNGDESGFIFNPDGFPYLNWQNPDDLPLSIKIQSKQSSLNLNFDYQNNRLNISFNKIQNLTLSIYSLTGKLVLSKNYYNTQIIHDLSQLRSSIYIVKIKSLNGSYSEKVLVK